MQQTTKLSTRVQLQNYLKRHQRENPTAPISFTHLAQEFGVSRERIRQLYNELKIFYLVPPVQERGHGMHALQREKYQQKFASIDRTVLGLRNRGMTYEQIVSYSGIPISVVERSCQRLIKNGVTVNWRSYEHRKEVVDQVKCLRLVGMTRPQIAQELGLSRSYVGSIISTLIQAGEVKESKHSPRCR